MKVIYPKKYQYSRTERIKQYCIGKNVLHIGSTDEPFTKRRMNHENNESLLYEHIDSVCKDQLGIDIDKEAIDMLNNSNKYKNSTTIYFDMNFLSNLDYRPDVIVFGETIEHVMNAETSLTNLKNAMDKDTILIISTPNCYNRRGITNAVRGYEIFHPDHKLFFSYGYLKNLLKFNSFKVIDSGFTNTTCFKVDIKKLSFLGKLGYYFEKYIIQKFIPQLSETLFFVVKKENLKY